MRNIIDNVLISIQGSQIIAESDQPEQVELITPGRLTRKGTGYLITYRESRLTGLEGTTTTLTVDGPRVTLSRTGEVCSHMIFEQGRRHLSYYETGDGQMTVGVSARRVRSALTDAGGSIEVDYSVEIDQAISGQNNIKVDVHALRS